MLAGWTRHNTLHSNSGQANVVRRYRTPTHTDLQNKFCPTTKNFPTKKFVLVVYNYAYGSFKSERYKMKITLVGVVLVLVAVALIIWIVNQLKK